MSRQARGRPVALHHVGEDAEEVVGVLRDKTEAVIREFEASTGSHSQTELAPIDP